MFNSQVTAREKRDNPLLIYSLILTLSFVLSLSVVTQNYYLLFGILAAVFGVLLFRNSLLPVAVIPIIIAFTDWAVEYRYLPFQIMWLPELLSGILFIKSLAKKVGERQKYITPGLPIALSFLFVSLFSLIANNSPVIPALLMLRILFRYYLLFLAIINLGFDEKSQKVIINILIFIFLVQLPLSVVKLFVHGQGETSLGLSSHSVSTIFPLIAIGFLLSYYFVYRRRLSYLLAALGFVGFSIVGGKRAFIFFMPVLLIFLAWLLRKENFLRLRFIILVILFFSLSLYFVARLVPTLNPQRKIWGEFSLRHMVDYAISYETNVSLTGEPTGRISATVQTFKVLSRKNLSGYVFGYGPGTIIKSMFSGYDRRAAIRSQFGIEYGINGLSWLGIQVGYVGTVIYMLIFYYLMKKCYCYYKKEKDPFWRSFALGMAGFSFILLFTSLVYTPFFNHDAVSAFYFCLVAIVIIRLKSPQRANYIEITKA